MRIILYPDTVISGRSYMDLVQGMQCSPFTMDIPGRKYMEQTLALVCKDPPGLPDDGETAALEFLITLGGLGLLSWLPEHKCKK